MKRKFDLYLSDILQAIGRVQEYIGSMDAEEFIKSTITVDAVMRNLEIIGEASTQLQKWVKEKYTNIPWRDIQDFRIIVAHKYWGINKDRIWDIIQNKLEVLRLQIEDILAREKAEVEQTKKQKTLQ